MEEENEPPEDIDDEEFFDGPPQGYPSWEVYRADMEMQAAEILKDLAEKKLQDKIDADNAAADLVVFKLTQSLETENPEDPDFAKILTRNAKILNNAFEYYLEHADQSKLPDRKIGLGIRMQSQLIRTIDVWRRLENSQNGKTK